MSHPDDRSGDLPQREPASAMERSMPRSPLSASVPIDPKANTAAYRVYCEAADKRNYVAWRDVQACIQAYLEASAPLIREKQMSDGLKLALGLAVMAVFWLVIAIPGSALVFVFGRWCAKLLGWY